MGDPQSGGGAPAPAPERVPTRPDQAAGRTGQPDFAEREFETGTDEFFKAHSEKNAASESENLRNLYANIKRTYDEYQDLGLASARNLLQLQTNMQRMLETTFSNHQVLANQTFQNAIETSNLLSKKTVENMSASSDQRIRHADIAIDAQWNPVEEGAGNVITGGVYPPNRAVDTATAGVAASAEAVAAAVAKAVDASVSPLVAVLAEMVKALAANTTAQAKSVQP